ncbi:hypothetical protein PHMEG_0001613 [Phytophthora megakarya]|uniref:Uncharacterized protein n=1 Tax=Phytophthora megakarya TaxID=4795 RepID=A0A225X175_9STRA|nr:hypothetical protein PHMEG_0001613 [Phytophthora megakarya]
MWQRNQTNALEKRVQQLQHYIPVLELQRTQLIYDESQDMWAVVVEYCEKFRYGVKSEDGHQYSDQLEFLRSSMVQDVALGEHCGVQELMDWWRRYSSVFKDLQLQPKCMQRVSEGFMRVSAILSVTVSVFTLEKVFPNLKTVSLLSKLLGRRLRLPCCLWFEWDASSSRVVRVEMTVNYVTAMMKVFGNLSVVASVLAHAHITRYGGVQVCVASDS